MLGNVTLCLSMIVKDEVPVIRRCLESALSFIDHWIVVDTGSTDGTQDLVREVLSGIPGELLEYPWCDFSTNRTQALLPALRTADYVLILDADEDLEAEPWFAPRGLDADSYVLTLRRGAGQALSRRILASRLPWAWVGVLHEYPECPQDTVNQRLPGLAIGTGPGGARSRDPRTHAQDLAVLRAAIADDPGNARYRFFAAQIAYDAGDHAAASDAWRDFLAVATDREETFHARLLLARCLERLGQPWPEVAEAYMRAWATEPHRAEPCVHLAEHYFGTGEVALADIFLRHAYACPVPLAARLPIDLALHRWVIPVQYSYCCFKLGRLQEALAVVSRTLGTADLPPEIQTALLENQGKLLAALAGA